VREVEALSTHLSTNTAILNLENQVAKSRISKVKVPHILEGTLVDLSEGSLASSRATKGVATSSSGWHLLDDLQGILQKVLLGLILLDSRFHLTLDSLPNVVERSLGGSKLATVMVESRVDAELIVRTTISEVESGRDREVGLKGH
jgi:hypothetical protein